MMRDWMLSRRELLRGAAVASGAGLMRRMIPDPSQPATPVRFDLPRGACDCHIHIFGDVKRFPFAAERVYTPEPASVEQSRQLHRALKTTRTVLIQPSVYGTDNSCMLDALGELGGDARGIAVIADDPRQTSDATLAGMERAGVRGVRINLETVGQTDPAIGRRRFQAAVERLAGRRWHIQIYTRLSVVERIRDLVETSALPVVFDHLGGAQASLGVEQPGFGVLSELVRSGKAYVKLSAIYRGSTQAPDYPDVAPLARALIAANPDRILWGSDWPHVNSQAGGRAPTEVTPDLRIDDGRVMNQLPVWAPDPALRQKVLVDNPARLYHF